jgi:hypothetical protein
MGFNFGGTSATVKIEGGISAEFIPGIPSGAVPFRIISALTGSSVTTSNVILRTPAAGKKIVITQVQTSENATTNIAVLADNGTDRILIWRYSASGSLTGGTYTIPVEFFTNLQIRGNANGTLIYNIIGYEIEV